jgi:hypothetical protein
MNVLLDACRMNNVVDQLTYYSKHFNVVTDWDGGNEYTIKVTDSKGNVLEEHKPDIEYHYICKKCGEIEEKKTYTCSLCEEHDSYEKVRVNAYALADDLFEYTKDRLILNHTHC